jgi:hypothetical protein
VPPDDAEAADERYINQLLSNSLNKLLSSPPSPAILESRPLTADEDSLLPPAYGGTTRPAAASSAAQFGESFFTQFPSARAPADGSSAQASAGAAAAAAPGSSQPNTGTGSLSLPFYQSLSQPPAAATDAAW